MKNVAISQKIIPTQELCEMSEIVPFDTGRRLSLHKTLRRRLEQLLSIICTFSLCPVSQGDGAWSGKLTADFRQQHRQFPKKIYPVIIKYVFSL